MKRILLIIAAISLSISVMAQNATDTTRVLCIGNSFTYVAVAHEKLAEISLSQGHYLNMKAAYVGGHTFRRHLNDIKTISAIELANPYDEYAYVFLQDQSQIHARYAMDPKRFSDVKAATKELVAFVREYSPHAKLFLESTWSYDQNNFGQFGSYANFDNLLRKGTALLAKAAHTEVSPIGTAFALVREERSDIDLYDKDRKHQCDYGSYLKACVNYLLMFGTKFDANASDCGLDQEKCAYLRSVAERVVL